MSPVLDPPRAGVVGREAELTTIREFVAGISAGPCSLLLEGAVGIGKTTLWRAGVRAAQECSYRVLSCRPAALESRLAFAALIDMFADVDAAVLRSLPGPPSHGSCERQVAIPFLRSRSSAPSEASCQALPPSCRYRAAFASSFRSGWQRFHRRREKRCSRPLRSHDRRGR